MQSTVCIEPLSTVQRHFLLCSVIFVPLGPVFAQSANVEGAAAGATYKRTAMFRLLLL